MTGSTGPLRRGLAALAALAAVATGCGDEEPQAAAPPTPGLSVTFPSVLPTVPKLLGGGADRAAPRWEELKVFSGTGATETAPFTIEPASIQWRVKWTCESGNLKILARAAPDRLATKPLADTACPKAGEGFSIQTGDQRLAVETPGSWKVTIEQQVESPLSEAPLPGMTDASAVLRGSFYSVEKPGKGTATLHTLPDGSLALRFSDDFQVFNNTDLYVWLSTIPQPKTSAEASTEGSYREIAALKSTRGSQNYVIPRDLPLENITSIVLWCQPVPTAYIAAGLA